MSETATSQPTVVRTDRGLSIAGTRITLYHVMDYVTAGWPPHLIRDWLNLTEQQIQDVIVDRLTRTSRYRDANAGARTLRSVRSRAPAGPAG
jgi:hypothetical protein